jgi:hypothetical protein
MGPSRRLKHGVASENGPRTWLNRPFSGKLAISGANCGGDHPIRGRFGRRHPPIWGYFHDFRAEMAFGYIYTVCIIQYGGVGVGVSRCPGRNPPPYQILYHNTVFAYID